MTHLDEEGEQLLRGARREFTPTSEQAARVRAGVVAAVALTGCLTAAEGAAGGTKVAASAGVAGGKWATLGHGLWVSKVWLGGAILAATSAAGIWAATAADDPSGVSEAPRATSASYLGATRASDSAAAAAEPTEATADLEELAEPEESHGSMELEHAGPNPNALRKPAARPTPIPSAAPRKQQNEQMKLSDELAGVRSAELALNAGNVSRVLTILDEFERAPGGGLHEERAALRVLAHCRLGSATSRDRALAFLGAYGGSVYAPRVRSECPE